MCPRGANHSDNVVPPRLGGGRNVTAARRRKTSQQVRVYTKPIPGTLVLAAGWFTLKTSRVFLGECPRFFFFIHTVKFCMSSTICALARISPVFCLFCFYLIFLSVWIFEKMWTTLAQFFRRKQKIKNKKNAGQDWGWACRTRVQNFRVCLSKTA